MRLIPPVLLPLDSPLGRIYVHDRSLADRICRLSPVPAPAKVHIKLSELLCFSEDVNDAHTKLDEESDLFAASLQADAPQSECCDHDSELNSVSMGIGLGSGGRDFGPPGANKNSGSASIARSSRYLTIRRAIRKWKIS